MVKRFALRCLLAVLIVSTSYGVLWTLQEPDDPMTTVTVSRAWLGKIFAAYDEQIRAQQAYIAELEEQLLRTDHLERPM